MNESKTDKILSVLISVNIYHMSSKQKAFRSITESLFYLQKQ
jgi:hypothetical protein